MRFDSRAAGETNARQEEQGSPDRRHAGDFEEPKLEFIEPELTEHGDVTKVTHAFFGTFVP
jgi:hypothetical protein